MLCKIEEKDLPIKNKIQFYVEVFLCFFSSFSLNIPKFTQYRVHSCVNLTGHCFEVIESPATDGELWTIYSYFYEAVIRFCPTVAIIILNILLFRKLRNIWSRRSSVNSVNSESDDKNCEKSMSILVISVVFVYFILTTPGVFAYIYHVIHPLAHRDRTVGYLALTSITNLLEIINYSANFFLYCCVNQYIRNHAKSLLQNIKKNCCKKLKFKSY